MSLGGATIGTRMAEKNWKSEKMGAKFVRTTSTFEMKKNYYHSIFPVYIVDVHPYKNISLPR